jgi:hypothetical protein
MREQLERRLVERWPKWFNAAGDTRETLMPFGFAHGDGWFDLVWRLCERLEPVVSAAEKETERSFHVLQVKEKLGGLRFYPNYNNDPISALIEAAEIESFRTCEVCGQPENTGASIGSRPLATSTWRVANSRECWLRRIQCVQQVVLVFTKTESGLKKSQG